ncbi:energy-coupling factor transporter transmembrane component T family protein [Prauserella cavernicola]|uniref:Energy-coupling factor transporter transmembrane protein EcfT n=1 Tax=Prauserella cavernicola TaxID=2800127 RepID=A0A934QML7_9PSEU|nr:energy-coupling factor transporter transmembrane protein EcfT [Prauserella cavernicola]MBK1784687.1 energy-coupling factor transporter transmembrane protein EcfT [Prauserella cavernicola]
MISAHVPGTSVVHRAPVGAKLLVLFALAVTVFVLERAPALGALFGVVALGYALARIPASRWLRTARALLLLAVFVFALQWWLLGAGTALVICLRLLTALAAANLFTLTTPVDEVVSAVERWASPLRRFGVRPESVGLLVGLTMQAVTALSGIAREVREAAKARGAERSVTAFAVPFLVRTLRHADELGEALAARGATER